MTRFCIILCFLTIASCKSGSEKASDSLGLFVDFTKPKGVNLNVSSVSIADSFLKIDTAINVFENKIGKKIIFAPEEYQKYGLVNCPNNGLIQTIQECYDNHRPLILTPDIVWLAICQGVSLHVNEKYDSLKNILFKQGKPDKIVVRNDSLEFNGKNWVKLLSSFSGETKKYTKQDYYSFFVSQFSTTTDIEKTAYQITLLESYKKAFEYVGETGCGIPSITITGTKTDWQTILVKIDQLNKIGLSNWSENLKPIITEFINVFDGKVDKEFWQSIYKNTREYNAFYITGWIIKFFPYTKELEGKGIFDKKLDKSRVGEIFKRNEFLDGNRYLLSTLSTDNFPSGVAKINITWNNYLKNTTKDVEVYAGFFAIKQYSDKSLEPLISWAVCDKSGKSPNHNIIKNGNLNLIHSEEKYWSPHICKEVRDSAIYDIKHFKTHKASIGFIRLRLQDSLFNTLPYKSIDLSNDTVEFVVFTNGTIGEVVIKGDNKSKKLSDYLTRLLLGLPEKWFPALAHPRDVLELMDDFTDDQNKVKVRVNSIVKITLLKK